MRVPDRHAEVDRSWTIKWTIKKPGEHLRRALAELPQYDEKHSPDLLNLQLSKAENSVAPSSIATAHRSSVTVSMSDRRRMDLNNHRIAFEDPRYIQQRPGVALLDTDNDRFRTVQLPGRDGARPLWKFQSIPEEIGCIGRVHESIPGYGGRRHERVSRAHRQAQSRRQEQRGRADPLSQTYQRCGLARLANGLSGLRMVTRIGTPGMLKSSRRRLTRKRR